MRHITHCINQKLTELCLEAIKLEDINAMVLPLLPDNLQGHCRVGSFRNGNLILVTNDSVWASQLRYLAPQLRDNLRKTAHLYQLASVQIKVQHEGL